MTYHRTYNSQPPPLKPGVRLPIAGEPTKLGKQTLFGILAIAAKR